MSTNISFFCLDPLLAPMAIGRLEAVEGLVRELIEDIKEEEVAVAAGVFTITGSLWT